MTADLSERKPKALRQRGATRRELLLQAAADVFFRRGYERATLSEIIALAGGSKTLLYEQFGDKAGLFRATLDRRCADILAPLSPEISGSGKPRDVLTQFGRNFVKALSTPEILALQRTVIAEGTADAGIGDIYFAAGHDAVQARLAQYIATLRPEGDDDQVECERLAALFLAMVQGDAIERLLVGASVTRSPEDLDHYVEIAVDWILGCIGSGSAAPRPRREPLT